MVINPWLKNIIKRSGIVFGIILVLLIAALSVANYYISAHKDKVIATIKEKVKQATGANIDIRDLDISIWRDFPRLRVGLSDVVIQDTVFKLPLLQLSKVYTKINLLEAVFSHVKLGEIRILNGQINLLTDSLGYTNLSIFKSHKPSKDSDSDNTKKDLNFNNVYIENVQFILDDKKGKKYYGIHINKVKARLDPIDARYRIDLKMDVKVNGLAFNIQKGPYLMNRRLQTQWNNMKFDLQSGDLTFDKSPVEIDDHIFNIGGAFNFSGDSAKSKLDLKIDSKATTFQDCASLLASNIQESLKNYTCSNKIDVEASLYGSLQQSTPHVLVKIVAANNNVGIKSLDTELDSCSFIGNYNNQNIKDSIPDDKNSTIIIEKFKGSMTGVPLVGKKLNIINLVDPFIDMSLVSAGRLVNLNQQLDLQTLSFLDGQATFSLMYNGRVPSGIGLLQNLSGELSVHNGKAIYIPKNLLFENCNGNILFGKNKLKVDNLRATLNNNSILVNINGSSIVDKSSGKAVSGFINCDVNAPYLNLNYFSKLFQQGGTKQKITPKNVSKNTDKTDTKGNLTASSLQVDDLLSKGEFRLNINSKEVKYNNFQASNFQTNIVFKENDWFLKQFSMNHAGGSLDVSGTVNTISGNNNKAKINLNINKVQLDKLLYAFDNFGVNGLSYKNLKGTFTATADLSVLIDRNGKIVPQSSVGSINFRLENGQLLNYGPLLSIQKYVFKKRDLNNVEFANLSDTVLIRHGNFYISKMEIASTALRLFVEGIYSPKGNSDISIQVPFSSLLKKSEKDDALEKTDKNEKIGASIFLRATNDNGGPMNVKLDVFKKIRKNQIKERFEKEFGNGD